MSFTLGIDIGTFESKGVLVDAAGDIVAMATHPHEMIVLQRGWAEHRAEDDWWGATKRIIKILIAEDNPGLARVLSFKFKSTGFEPITCANGKLAWETFQKESVAAGVRIDSQQRVDPAPDLARELP